MGNSSDLFQRAKKVIPGGVNSPVRAWKSVGGDPLFIDRGSGSHIFTADGLELIDFCGSWGPLLLGHAHPEVVKAVRDRAAKGLTFGATTRLEVELAELLCETIPNLDMVRLVNSGTEATMTAIRLARGYTKRDKILKFDGCYHGHSDFLLVSAGSGLLTGGFASSAGIPEKSSCQTLVAPFNDLEAARTIVSKYGSELAAVIVEPVAGNMGLVKPNPGFLRGLRELTHSCGALLIFDEVITGFRVGPTTYGAISKIDPDVTCLGKIIGGGMPIGALGGAKDLMETLAPDGKVYQAGTLSGNPIAVTAGLTTLKILVSSDPYPEIERKIKILVDGLESFIPSKNTPYHCSTLGGMFTPFFTAPHVTNLEDAKQSNTKRYAKFFHFMLSHGFYLPPSQFEVSFISIAHEDEEIEKFLDATKKFFRTSCHEP